MKRIRLLLLMVLVVFSMAFFTGCGKVEEPTVDDVIEALKDEGYIPEDKKDKDDDKKKDDDSEEDADSDDEDSDKSDDSKDKSSWDVTIDKCKLNDDKDKATVTATLKVTDEYVETSTEFKLTFKLKDDKSWKCREVSEGDTTRALKNGISDDDVERIVKNNMSFSFDAGDSYVYLYDDDITSVKVGEHDTDLEEMEDVVTVSMTGVDGHLEVSFDVEITFKFYEYSSSWDYYDYEIVGDPEVDYSESYQFKLSADDIVADMSDEDEYEYIYFLGTSYKFWECEITDFDFDEVSPDGSSYLEIPCTFTLTKGDVSIEVSAEIDYYYNGEEWEYYYLSDDTVTGWSSAIIDTWTGTDTALEGATITIEIPEELEEDSWGDPTVFATVTVKSKDNGTYSWISEVYNYDPEEASISMSFEEWITEPKDGDRYAYSSYSGSISDGVWSGTSWSTSYEFRNSTAAPAPTPEPTKAPEPTAAPDGDKAGTGAETAADTAA